MLSMIWAFAQDRSGAAWLELALIMAILGVALVDVLIGRGAQMNGELGQVGVLRR